MPVAEAASEWDAWRRDVFGEPYLVWHDGADFETVLTIWTDDPDQVHRMLALGLAVQDPLAAQTAGVLARRGHALGDVETQLRARLSHASGTFCVRVAEALFVITGDTALAEPVCAVLANGSFWGDRRDAAIALNAFPSSPSVDAALARGVVDEEYLVRRHSAQTMLILVGKHTTIEKLPDIWNLIRSARSRRSWRETADRLRALA